MHTSIQFIRNRIKEYQYQFVLCNQPIFDYAAMPTAFRDGPYRFYFYSFDCNEPMHVHVGRDRNEAKFWLEPVEIAFNHGFAGHELRKVEKIIREQRSMIREAWHEHCGHA